jgi:uncharacterized protein (TIGR03435 family)
MKRAFASLSLFAILAASSLAQTAKTFVIADVHPSPYTTQPFMHGNSIQGDRYFLTQATMLDLVATAYGVDNNNVQGGPPWLELDRFDIRAKVPDGTKPDDVKPMLRALLADRFHLVVKNATAPMPAYVLSVAKSKMTESESTGDGSCVPQPPPQNSPAGTVPPIVVICKGVAMPEFAQILRNFSGGYFGDNPVVDGTGLKGNYDFTLSWTWKGDLGKAGKDGITLFDAVDKQLGLKLDLKTAPRPVFLVQSVEKIPTPNPANIAEALPEPPPQPFEVATIKPSAPDEKSFGRITGGQIQANALPLMFLVNFAWDLNPNNKESLVNAPKWLETAKFDINAKAGANVRVDKFAGQTLINFEDLRSMLRAMLTERFQMKTHMEERPVTAYTLVAAGPKLKPTADPTERTKCKEGPGPDGKDPRIASPILNRLLTCQNMTMAQIGDELQRVANGYIYNPVIDSTGLKGSYDFTLSFSSADKVQLTAGADASSADPSGALSIFDAVNRQLGLKLEKTKRPYPVLVIDSMSETPTEN